MQNKPFPMSFIAGILMMSGFIIFFPFFSSKAQKSKSKITQQQPSPNDTSRRKVIVINPAEIEKAFAGLDSINLPDIQNTVEAALASVNEDGIRQSVEASLKSVHADSIRLQVEAAMQNVNMQKMQQDLAQTMSKTMDSTMKKELQQAMKEVQQAMQELGKIDHAAIRKELENAKKDIAASRLTMQKDLSAARQQIQKGRTELTQLRMVLSDMKKDGLIKEDEKVKLEWKGNRLFINDKEQSAEVSEKYKSLKNLHLHTEESDVEEDENNEL